MYESAIEPWSFRLTGQQGLAPNPFWDPLQFAIAEAHKRGLDLHAWLNPYRVKANNAEYKNAENSILVTQPNWILTASNNKQLKFLNPGLPDVRDYITKVVADISTRYNIDGIHFDDYFYPNAGMTTNADRQTFLEDNPDEIENIKDWRRNNVNILIANVYDAIQEINEKQHKNIQFGVSPFGIWKSGTPAGTKGNSSFDAMFCDSIAWLNAGKVDYLAPQFYWQIKGKQDYITLSKWWNDQLKSKNKQLFASQAVYRMTDIGHWPVAEIQNQINHNRSQDMDCTFGQIAYRYESLRRNDKKINDVLRTLQYQYKSFPSPAIGKDSICANMPVNLRFEDVFLKWDTPTTAIDGDLPKKYVIYNYKNEDDYTINKNTNVAILDIVGNNQVTFTKEQIENNFYAITSLDKNNNESEMVFINRKKKKSNDIKK